MPQCYGHGALIQGRLRVDTLTGERIPKDSGPVLSSLHPFVLSLWDLNLLASDYNSSPAASPREVKTTFLS